MDHVLTVYNRIVCQLEMYDVQLQQCGLRDSCSDFSSSCNETSLLASSSQSISKSSGKCRHCVHSRSRKTKPQQLHRQGSRTSFCEDGPYQVPKELGISTILLPLEHLPCSQPSPSQERPVSFNSKMTSSGAASIKDEKTDLLAVPCATCKTETVARRATSTSSELKIQRKSPYKRWQFAILVVRIVRMLLPPRLRHAQKASTVKASTKGNGLDTSFILPSAIPPLTTKPLVEMTKASLNSQVFLQKLELHMRRKLSEQLWGFPKQVVKYVGEHIVQQRLSGNTGNPRTEGKFKPSGEQPGHYLKNLQNKYLLALEELNLPKPKPIFQLVEQPEILKNPGAPRNAQQDDHLRDIMDTKSLSNLGMKQKAEQGMKPLEEHTRKRRRLANRHTFHSSNRLFQLMTISAIVSTQTPQADSLTIGPPLKGRQAVTFINKPSLNQIEQNLILKYDTHLQGIQTPYSLSLEKLATASTQDHSSKAHLMEKEGRTSASWFLSTPP